MLVTGAWGPWAGAGMARTNPGLMARLSRQGEILQRFPAQQLLGDPPIVHVTICQLHRKTA